MYADFFSRNRVNFHNNMDLDSMKYAELRSLAKELGLKANMKVMNLPFLNERSDACRLL